MSRENQYIRETNTMQNRTNNSFEAEVQQDKEQMKFMAAASVTSSYEYHWADPAVPWNWIGFSQCTHKGTG